MTPQRMINTGDIVVNSRTQKKCQVHYVVGLDGQTSFSERAAYVTEVIVYDETNGNQTLKVEDIYYPRRKI